MHDRILAAAAVASLTLFASVATAQSAKEMSAQQVVDKMLDQNNSLGVDQGQAQLTLLVEDRTGEKRKRVIEVSGKESEKGGRTRVKLLAPAEVKGQAFLFWENKAGDDDVWMFLPAFSVTRRIEGSQKKGAFLGTHFTFADLESRDIRKAEHKRLEDAKIGKSAVFVIESTPSKSADSDYGKVTSFVRQSDYMPLKFKFYGKDGKDVIKTIFVEKIDKTAKGQPYIKQMTLRSKQGGYTTIMLDSVKEDIELADSLFDKDNFGN